MTIKAALHTSNETHPYLEVGDKEIPAIADHQVLIRARAFAANPTDWKHKALGTSKKGDVAGTDVSGVVKRVGKNVHRVKVGDYVGALVRGNFSPDNGAWAEYVAADERGTVVVPKTQVKDEPLTKDTPYGPLGSFEAIASVPVGLATVGLSFSFNLQLQRNGGTILIWSGATSTGVVAIQVAKLVYGLKVITTASPKHHDFLKALGADAVFDYHDENVVSQIKQYAKGSINVALDTHSSPESLQQVYDATEGSVKIDNLSLLDASAIKQDPARDVTISATVGYLLSGSFEYKGQTITAPPGLLDAFDHFWTELLPPVIPKLKTNNLRVLAPGLGSGSEALELLQSNKVSGQKVVFHV